MGTSRSWIFQLRILEWAPSSAKIVAKCRWERTTGKCSNCGHLQNLELRERVFHCENCNLVIGRDHNAAINIKTVGTSTDYLSGSKTKVCLRSHVDGSSPAFRRGECHVSFGNRRISNCEIFIECCW
ncbi:MAG: transposase [Anaerolineales bacterium]|nr:transposase [Anaerolineales bacterium]